MFPDKIPILVSIFNQINSLNLPVRNPLYLYLLLIGTFSSCTLFPPEEARFGYLEIPDVTLQTSPSAGFPSHAIRDVWVYADGEDLGVYALPATIPVLSGTESKKFQVRGGVKVNGNNATSREYPFFNEVVLNEVVGEDQNISRNINFTYKSEAVFDLVEDFESGNQFDNEVDGDAQTYVQRVAGQSPYGNHCGYIRLSGANDAIEVSHSASFPNSNNKKGAVFLEFDYKCDEKIFVGTILDEGGLLVKDYKILVTETDTWKKFYLDLTEEISNSNVIRYKVVFSSTLISGGTEANIYLDNIKLIHF